MLMERLRTKRCQKSATTSRSRCRQGKEIDKGVPLSNYGKNVGTRLGRRRKWVRGSELKHFHGDLGIKNEENGWKGTETLMLFKEVSFLLFFSGLSASLRSVSFSLRRKEWMCEDLKEVPRKYFV